ncbi:MAG: hypothetical protein K0S63_1076 [Gammaproteobacteria bacterium]|jgi:hypothetical protein|nr:hypothetical protein [Gammaproteobacteria bacterium]
MDGRANSTLKSNPDGRNNNFLPSPPRQRGGKWCEFFCPPHFEKLDVINRFGNILYGLNGSASALHLAPVASLTASLGTTLPFFGIVAGVIDLLNYAQQYGKDKYDNIEHFFPLRVTSSLFLTIMGIQEAAHFRTFAVGVPGCGLLFMAFAIKSFLDFSGALWDWSYWRKQLPASRGRNKYNTLSKNVRDAFYNMIIQPFIFTGWTLLATGHPLGWAFLAATALINCGYQVYSAYQDKMQSETGRDNTGRTERPNNGGSRLPAQGLMGNNRGGWKLL